MATLRQKKLASAIVTNSYAVEPLNKQELVASVGYSEMSAEKKATEIIESKGTQFELRQLGFDEESAKAVVTEILEHGEDDSVRLGAAKEIFKVFGTYAAEKSFNLTVNSTVEQLNDQIRKDLAKFRPNT